MKRFWKFEGGGFGDMGYFVESLELFLSYPIDTKGYMKFQLLYLIGLNMSLIHAVSLYFDFDSCILFAWYWSHTL